ncbi:MAG: SBBP repeat-containing protein [Bryobacterales bacterium]|nr:SBBP repeat-containing protein [Bryobacterales bacterium]
MRKHLGVRFYHLSTALLMLIGGWLAVGGPSPDPFETGFAKCLDTENLDPEESVCLLAIGFATGGGALDQLSHGQPGDGGAAAFELNLGQADRAYQFISRGKHYTAFLDAAGVTFDLRGPRDVQPTVLRAQLAGAIRAGGEGLDVLPGRVNYLGGPDPAQWITDVPVYGRVQYQRVYEGIDVVYYGNDGWIEYDFLVQPGADPSQIAVRLTGADGMTVNSHGDLELRAAGRTILWKKPALYQRLRSGARRAVEGRYRLLADGAGFGFEVGRYDPAQPLVIDPVVVFTTLFGSSVSEGASRLAVDANGNSYLTGITIDNGFPVSPGAFNSGSGGLRLGNAYVTKMNAAGTQMVYTTHFGGAFLDGAVGVAVDAAGNAYLAGATKSQDFPVSPTAIQRTLLGTRGPGNGMDCFVAKLNAAGNGLAYGTYLGGNATDACTAIAVDSAGSAYVAGWTNSTNFVTSENAPQRQNRGGNDVFVAKLNPAGTVLVWSTLVGGIRSEEPTALALDGQNNVYVTGHTNSNLQFAAGTPLQRNYGGSAAQARLPLGDAFVIKVNADGGSLGYATYLGGRGDEIGGAIAVDAQGNVYVAGATTSTDFPTTAQAVSTTYRGTGGNTIFPGGDAFVAKLNPAGTALVWSTLLGGARDDWATSLVVDASGQVWVAGATMSTDFPVTQDALQRNYGGTDPEANFPTGDAFLAQVNAAGTSLVYASYLGGASDDFAMGLAADRSGDVLVSGSTRSQNFPVTPGAAQTRYAGHNTVTIPLGDAFLAKFSGGSAPSSNMSVAFVGSAASGAGGGVAPGEMVVLYGSGIGPATLTTSALNAARDRLETTLAGTRVLFDGVAAPLIYVSAGQTSAMVPYGVAGRALTQMAVEVNGARSPAIGVPVVASKPALFSANSSGRGPGAILNENGSLNTAANPSEKGRIVVLYGTGEGQTDPPGADGLLALTRFPKPVLPVSVTIGGLAADVLYAGAAPQGVAGFFQVNAKVPENASSGALEVIVTVGAARSQTGLTVAVR